MHIVLETIPFPLDYGLAQRCIETDPAAIQQLQDSHRAAVVGYLQKSGATLDEAEEVTEWLWADCLQERPDRRPRLATYAGQASLRTWLYSLALNRLIARKRLKRREEDWKLATAADPVPSNLFVPGEEPEAPLIELMRDAVEAGFRECRPEDFVLLQLAHIDQIQMRELALMFRCSKSKICRDIAEAETAVSEATLRYVRKIDPWLDLRWEDFVEICGVASPACFGLE